MKKFLVVPLLLCFLLVFVSCNGGGEDAKSGSAISETVRIMPPTFDKSVVYSDVAVWQDKNGDGKVCDYVNDTFSVTSDTVNMTVSVVSIANLPQNFQKSPVRLDTLEIKYSPADRSSPAIPAQYYTLSAVIQPDSSYTIPIEVIPQSLKLAFQPALICSDNVYRYYVAVTVRTTEILTGNRGEIQGHFTLVVGDFPEQPENQDQNQGQQPNPPAPPAGQ